VKSSKSNTKFCVVTNFLRLRRYDISDNDRCLSEQLFGFMMQS
jgi:hypothetical protein